MLAFKAQEIEELADVYFFRPLGMVFALAARALGLSPTIVTVVSMLFGVAGGALLYTPATALAGFALVVFYSVLDSSDGQLARMTGRSSEFGRMLDGIGGYVTHAAIYMALVARMHESHGWSVIWWAIGAGIANVVHAQLYDYHRTLYIRCAIDGRPRLAERSHQASTPTLVRWYEAMETGLAGLHPQVEDAMARRAINGLATDDDRRRYRELFYWPVRGWNLFGDNTRIYAIGVVALLQRPEWFFVFLVAPMNVALAATWLWQRRVDRRFLAGV